MIKFNITKIAESLAQEFKACGQEVRPGILALDEKSDCYKALRLKLQDLIPRQPITVQDVTHGIIGNIKVALGMEAIPLNVLQERQQTCESCEYQKNQICLQCKCFLPSKQRLASSRCPLTPPKWKEYTNVVRRS